MAGCLVGMPCAVWVEEAWTGEPADAKGTSEALGAGGVVGYGAGIEKHVNRPCTASMGCRSCCGVVRGAGCRLHYAARCGEERGGGRGTSMRRARLDA